MLNFVGVYHTSFVLPGIVWFYPFEELLAQLAVLLMPEEPIEETICQKKGFGTLDFIYLKQGLQWMSRENEVGHD